MKDLFQTQKKIISIYVVWFFVNLVWLFMGFTGGNYNDYFWPFTEYCSSHRFGNGPLTYDRYTLSQTYDFSEFLVYAISPLVAWFVYLNFKKINYEQQ